MPDHRNLDLIDNAPENALGERWNTKLSFQENNYTWEQVIRVLRKHARLGLIVSGALLSLVALYAFSKKDFFKPTARLEIAPPSSGINTLREIDAATEAENQDYLETQVQILGSDALAVSVIRDLHLQQNSEFVSARQSRDSEGRLQTEKQEFQRTIPILQEQLDLANLTLAESLALEKFRKNLSVSSVRNTRLVELSYSGQNPRLAQLITNTLVAKFIDQNYRHRYTTTMQASEWLSAQLSDLRKKVEESGQAVADYQKQYGLVEVDDRDVPMSQLMSEVNRQLSEAQANRIEDEAFVRMVDDGHADAVPALREDKLYQDLMGRYVDLRTQLAQAKTIYGDANINLKKLGDQLTEVSIQIDAERKRVIARLRSTYASARHRESLMTGERDKLRTKMARMSSQLAAYHMLKTEANANVELYNTLQGRLREAGIYAGLRSSNIRVVDLASNLRNPSGPHRLAILSLGVVGSIAVAIVLCFLKEGFRNTVRTPDDVKSWIGLPSLALLPAMGRQRDLSLSGSSFRSLTDLWRGVPASAPKREVEIMKSATSEAEAMRDLRTALLYSRKENRPHVILISSSVEGEGKTTVAVNFAIALAQLGPTCLVDCDLRQSSVARSFKLQNRRGLTDVLMNRLELSDAVISVPEMTGLSILPGGTSSTTPSDTLSSASMVGVLETLKRQFSFVVIDSPPVIPFSDARFLSCFADEVVLVGRYELTTRRSMQRTTELLREVQASVAGVVLNGIDLSSPDFDYYTYGYRKWKLKKAPVIPIDEPPSDFPSAKGAMGAHA
jgi:capsular exopolysaccharide synthesis family protein